MDPDPGGAFLDTRWGWIPSLDANSQPMQVDDGEKEGGEGGGGGGSEADVSSCDTIGALSNACSVGRNERPRADLGAGDDDQIESSLVSEFEAQNPGMGSSSRPVSETDMEEGYSHLFTDAMKIQLRAQILVLGDLLKGISPSPDWLEEACLETGIGAEFGLPEPLDAPRDVRAEPNLQRIPSAFQDVEASMSPSSESVDPPTTIAAGRLSNPGEPSSGGKDFLFMDDGLPQERDVPPSGQLMLTYDHATTPRPNLPGENSHATDPRVHDSDKHLDLAQASAQDALTTATSALAQSHMVWARLHSQNHSEEGIARDARIASVAATVAAAASVAKAAVEAARAIAEVSVDAFIQAGGYQIGDTSLAQLGSMRSRPLQVADMDESLQRNNRESTSQHRSDMVESVVQAAGKAAEAATQAGVVLAKANPLIQMSGLSEFWARKQSEGDPEHERNGSGGNEVYGFDGGRRGDELDGGNEEDAAEEMEEDDASQDMRDVVNKMDDLRAEDIATLKGDVTAANVDEGGAAAAAAASEAEAYVENGVESNGHVDAEAIGSENVGASGSENVGASGSENVGASGSENVGANGNGEVRASRNGDMGADGHEDVGRSGNGDVGANEEEVAPPNEVVEPPEQENTIDPGSRTPKRGRGRGRGRSQGASTRAKRPKTSVEAPSDILASQTPEIENEPVSGRDVDARSPEHDADYPIVYPFRNGTPDTAPAEPSGETAPAQIPETEMQGQEDVSESPKDAGGEKRDAKQMDETPRGDVSPSAPAQTPEEERQFPEAAHVPETRADHVQESGKRGRGRGRRGRPRGSRASVGTSRIDVLFASSWKDPSSPAGAHGLETRADHGPGSGKRGRGRGRRGRPRGAKTLAGTSRQEAIPASSVRAAGEERPSQLPESELQGEDGVPESPKKAKRGRKRKMEKTPASVSGKDAAEQGVRESEGARNTHDVPENAIEGSAVEVMTDEVGLRGGWFSGTILRMTPNEAFVELHDLLTDDGKSNVREWFPLVEGFDPYHPRRHVRPIHPFSIFTEAGSRKRRRVALGSQTWHIGDRVDAFFQDAWWEGIVAELNDLDPSKATIYFPEENDTQIVKTWDLRPSFQWRDSKWMPWKIPVMVEDERLQKRHNIGDGTMSGPDDQKSAGMSKNGGPEMAEDASATPDPTTAKSKSPLENLEEAIVSYQRLRGSEVPF